MAKCIITGCDLQVKSGGMWCHGDLWVEGDCYIFNACVEGGEVLWVYSEYDEGGPSPHHRLWRVLRAKRGNCGQ